MQAPERQGRSGKHLVIAVHGIRTFGDWQERLAVLLKTTDPSIVVRPYKYGYFSALAFIFPPARTIETRRLRAYLEQLAHESQWDRIDIIAHSFGTHIVGYALRGLSGAARPRVHTIILAGSVLRSTFPWNELIGKGVERVVNECGTRDSILLLSHFLAIIPPFTGMAGRVGFYGLTGEQFVNRFYRFRHSDYFLTDGKPADGFMRDNWVPLLTMERPVTPVDERGQLTALHGLWMFVVNNAGSIKLTLFVTPILALVMWMFVQWQVAIATSLAAESERIVDQEPDLALLLSRRAYLTADNEETRRALYGVMQASRWIQAFLRDHDTGISSVAFSGDGKRLASAQELTGRRLVLWDVEGARRIDSYPKPQVPEPNGLRLVTADGYKRVLLNENGDLAFLWQETELDIVDTDTWRTTNRLTYRGDIAIHAASGKFAFIADRHVALEDRRRSSRNYIWPDEPVTELAFTEDGETLVARSPQKILLQDTRRQRIDDDSRFTQLPAGMALPVPGVKVLTVSGRDKLMAAIAFDGGQQGERLKVWDLPDGIPRLDLPTPHEWLGKSVAIWPGRNLIVSAGGGGSTGGHSIGVWDARAGTYLGPLLKGFRDATTAVAFSRDGRRLASGDAAGAVILWDFGTEVNPHLARKLRVSTEPVTSIAPDLRSNVLAVGTGGGDVVLFDGRSQRLVVRIGSRRGHSITDLAYGPAGKRLYVASADGEVELWDLRTNAKVASRRVLPEGGPLRLIAHPRQPLVLAVAESGASWLLDPKSLEPEPSIRSGPGAPIAFHPSGSNILTPATEGFSYLDAWNVESGRRTHRYILGGMASGIALRPDGNRTAVLEGFDILLLGKKITRRLAEPTVDDTQPTGELPAPSLPVDAVLKGHRNPPWRAVFSQDGAWLATAGSHLAPVARPDTVEIEGALLARQSREVQNLFLWSAETGRSMGRPLAVMGPQLRDLRFGDGGRVLYSLSGSGELIAWDLDPCVWAARAAQVANRELTDAERSQFLAHETWLYRALNWTREMASRITFRHRNCSGT